MTRSAIALALLCALLVGACGNPPSPSPSPSASGTSSPEPTSAAPTASTAAACTSVEIRATGGPWGGAAGSRGADVVIENTGSAPCLLPAGTTIALVDPGGTAVLSNTPAQAGSGPEVAPGAEVGFSLVFSNWCDESVALPLHVQLALAGDAVDVEGLIVATTDDLPPCNGPGQPATLSASDWQPG